MPIRIVCMSDTHGQHHGIAVPPGDILVYAGDMSKRGKLSEIVAFNEWLGTLPHTHKFVIAGNHDFAFEREPEVARAAITHATYLEDSAASIMGLTIYGSPWQPRFHDWAFNLDRGAALAEKWTRIPDRVDILITHGPPRGIGDRVYDGRLEGCDDLLERVRVVRPRLHVFGHIHEAAGVYRGHGTVFVNASCLKWLDTQPTCGPFLIDWETGEVLSSSADSDA